MAFAINPFVCPAPSREFRPGDHLADEDWSSRAAARAIETAQKPWTGSPIENGLTGKLLSHLEAWQQGSVPNQQVFWRFHDLVAHSARITPPELYRLWLPPISIPEVWDFDCGTYPVFNIGDLWESNLTLELFSEFSLPIVPDGFEHRDASVRARRLLIDAMVERLTALAESCAPIDLFRELHAVIKERLRFRVRWSSAACDAEPTTSPITTRDQVLGLEIMTGQSPPSAENRLPEASTATRQGFCADKEEQGHGAVRRRSYRRDLPDSLFDMRASPRCGCRTQGYPPHPGRYTTKRSAFRRNAGEISRPSGHVRRDRGRQVARHISVVQRARPATAQV
ncbi:hypothetical protein BOSEA31B_20307 [Hyphomicrobiales bacterium]|nr:hypothetical protein BOSEA31B_20307 [Hyphomicrobiales bacterium]CAH1702318.1 hypothetical protein BOSEA1005_30190 [Hyphomicrobiales bacterium]CAI0346520.1 hypothetical protein BO1005MUT1_520032 [Hyphomicrobiales bacterium]